MTYLRSSDINLFLKMSSHLLKSLFMLEISYVPFQEKYYHETLAKDEYSSIVIWKKLGKNIFCPFFAVLPYPCWGTWKPEAEFK